MKLNKQLPDSYMNQILNKVDKVENDVVELNSNLTTSDDTKFRFATDGEGNYGYLKADDSFVPFKNKLVTFNMSFTGGNQTNTYDVRSIYPDYKNLTKDDFYLQLLNYNYVYYSGSSGTTYHYHVLPAVTAYNASTGVVSINSGYLGFGNTNSGASQHWITSMKVVIAK